MPRTLTIDQAASMLQVKPNTVRRWVKTGRIPGCKIGRVYRVLEGDLERALRGELQGSGAIARLRASDVIGSFAEVGFSSADLMQERSEETNREAGQP